MIEADGWEDATHYLVVRGTAEDDPNLVIIPGLVPLREQGDRGDLSTSWPTPNGTAWTQCGR